MEVVENNLRTFNRFLENNRTQDYLASVLGGKKSSFINNLTALVSNNNTLHQCAPETLMYSALKATALELPLDQNLGFAYVLPYKDNKTGRMLAQFQIGYKGFVQLSIRSRQFKHINVRDVKEGEIVGEDFISGNMKFELLKENRDKAKTIGYVAYFKLTNGFEKMLYMSVEELIAHGKKFSQTFKRGYGLWKDDFDSMASKTVLKLLLSKYSPLSVEMQQAVTSDQAALTGDGKGVYVDNESYSEFEEVKVPEIENNTESFESTQQKIDLEAI